MPLMRKMDRVLVEMDIFCGLSETLEIEWRGRKITQPLDYLGLPFRCNLCCHIGTFDVTVRRRIWMTYQKNLNYREIL